MSAKDDGGPAFPITDEQSHNGISAEPGMTLRDYFIAHAPAEPWPEFSPLMPARPVMPPIEPLVNDDSEAPTDDERKALMSWRADPIWDAQDEYPHFSNWIQEWSAYWEGCDRHEAAYRIERRTQWPAYWADQMLKARNA